MTLLLKQGETLWKSNGTHEVDVDTGIARVCETDTEVIMDSEELYNYAIALVAEERIRNNRNPDTGDLN